MIRKARRSSAANLDGSGLLGSVFGRRALAARAASADLAGTGAPSHRRSALAPAGLLASLALTLAALLALAATPAQAEPPKLISYGSFEAGQNPVGVAVDQESHDVYVADLEAGTFSKFDEAGDPA